MKTPYDKMSECELLIEVIKELKEMKEEVKKEKKPTAQDFGLISNNDFMHAFNIKRGAATIWRNTGMLRFIKIGKGIHARIPGIDSSRNPSGRDCQLY